MPARRSLQPSSHPLKVVVLGSQAALFCSAARGARPQGVPRSDHDAPNAGDACAVDGRPLQTLALRLEIDGGGPGAFLRRRPFFSALRCSGQMISPSARNLRSTS